MPRASKRSKTSNDGGCQKASGDQSAALATNDDHSDIIASSTANHSTKRQKISTAPNNNHNFRNNVANGRIHGDNECRHLNTKAGAKKIKRNKAITNGRGSSVLKSEAYRTNYNQYNSNNKNNNIGTGCVKSTKLPKYGDNVEEEQDENIDARGNKQQQELLDAQSLMREIKKAKKQDYRNKRIREENGRNALKQINCQFKEKYGHCKNVIYLYTFLDIIGIFTF